MNRTRFYLSDGTPLLADVEIDVFREDMKSKMTEHHHFNIDVPGGKRITVFVRHIVAMEAVE